MTEVYISCYGSKSQAIANKITAALTADGIECFSTPYTPSDAGAAALKECRVFIIILNQAASYSNQVLDEICTACVRYNGDENITILPFQISDEAISDEAMHYIGRLQWTEAFDGDIDTHISELAAKAKDALASGRIYTQQSFVIKDTPVNLYTAAQKSKNLNSRNKAMLTVVVVLMVAIFFFTFFYMHNKAKAYTGTQYTVSSDGTTSWTEDGNTYTGFISNGALNGPGKAVYSNGSVYEGNFVDGAADGKGKCTFPNGNVYDGEWSNGKMNGYGVFTFSSSGSVFEGMWENGRRNGKGKFTTADGEVWEGTWKDDLEEGDFTITSPDGTAEKYVFTNGEGKLTE